MDGWPQSTSKAMPSSLSTPRISRFGCPVHRDGMITILSAPQQAVSSPQSSRFFISFSSIQHTAHNIGHNGLPPQRHLSRSILYSQVFNNSTRAHRPHLMQHIKHSPPFIQHRWHTTITRWKISRPFPHLNISRRKSFFFSFHDSHRWCTRRHYPLERKKWSPLLPHPTPSQENQISEQPHVFSSHSR